MNNVNLLYRLLKRKQLEIVTGGWVMNDEANSHWLSILQQLTVGQTWLKKHLNVTPTSSWSIDPFGTSATMPMLLKNSNFDNLLIQRTHYSVKKRLAQEKELEFRWRQLWGMYCSVYVFLYSIFSFNIFHSIIFSITSYTYHLYALRFSLIILYLLYHSNSVQLFYIIYILFTCFQTQLVKLIYSHI